MSCELALLRGRPLESQFTARDLEFLHEVGGSGEQDAPAVFNQRQTDRRSEMGFPAAGSTDQDQIGALADPAVAL